MDVVDALRADFSPDEVNATSLANLIGQARVADLRRCYFPRWRPNVVRVADPGLQDFRKIVVSDSFEASVVEAVAPNDLRYTVRLAPESLRD